MNKLRRQLAIATLAITLLYASPVAAQIPAPTPRPERVEITKGPQLELATDQVTIITWMITNPGGADVHYGIVHYGTDPRALSQTAKSPIRINRGHAQTTFRVRLGGLTPKTTYYYRVTSEDSTGKSSGVKSVINTFTTPGPGERIANAPLRPS